MTPILIFQSISSFNPNLREINFYEKYCQFIVWGPKLQALWRNRGSANWPKMDKFENISIIYCTKSKLKGGQFNEKNANSCILGPMLFHKTDPLLILILCEIKLKIFLIGQFWADRQTPHF